MIATTELSTQQARAMVQHCFAELQASASRERGFLAETDEPDLELSDQREMSRDRVMELRQQLLSGAFSQTVRFAAEGIVSKHELSLDGLTESSRIDVMSGVARALIEEQRLFQFRLADRLATYVPNDPLFAIASQVSHSAPESPDPTKGGSVGQAIAEYLKTGKGQWVRKTHQARVWQLGFFIEHVGATLPLEMVTVDHVRTFREGIRALHRRHGRMKGSFAQRQTTSIGHRISDKTAAITFQPIKAFFRWASSKDGRISRNPAECISLIVAKATKGIKPRRPFTSDEIIKLFSSPIYTGSRSSYRRYEVGAHIIKDAKYWIPILGMYTGARLGELVQLQLDDIKLDGPIAYLSINEDNSAATGLSDRKHVKSAAGIREVPLHPDIITLGFATFVEERRKAKSKSRGRLFYEFPFGSDGQASTVASKWFARFMDKVGLTDRALVFHSFRHGVEDDFRNAGQHQYVIDRIVGHADGSTSAGYGQGISLETAYEAIKAMKLKVRLPDIVSKP